MKFIFGVVFILSVSSCSVVEQKNRNVSLPELSDLLKNDNSNPSFLWLYLGTDDKFHYFKRELMAVGRSDEKDGIYLVDKNVLALGTSTEFRVEKAGIDSQGRVQAKRVFTRIIGNKVTYDLKYRPQDLFSSP